MCTNIAIRVENLSKRYRIGQQNEIQDTFSGVLTSFVQNPLRNLRRLRRMSHFENNNSQDIIWALKDISFIVEPGEVVGIIGPNGAGKSTLLKILSRITEPTSGQAEIYGRVSSLLEVGTGFHPELTGRDNIYLNGSILGMRKAEINQKFDQIVEFSGIEKFIDTSVKFYSSGMSVRLAFSVAAHLEPEILLVDEVLAVGDAEFRKKCLGKMGDVAKEGRTILFVSHNMGAISKLCKKGILLESGSISETGDIQSVINHYFKNSIRIENKIAAIQYDKNCFNSIKTLNASGVPSVSFLYEQAIYIQFVYNLVDDVKGLYITFSLYTSNGFRLLFSDIQENEIYSDLPNSKGVHTITAKIPARTLAHGEYFLRAGLSIKYKGVIDLRDRDVGFEILKLNSLRDENNRPPLCPDIDWNISS